MFDRAFSAASSFGVLVLCRCDTKRLKASIWVYWMLSVKGVHVVMLNNPYISGHAHVCYQSQDTERNVHLVHCAAIMA